MSSEVEMFEYAFAVDETKIEPHCLRILFGLTGIFQIDMTEDRFNQFRINCEVAGVQLVEISRRKIGQPESIL